MVMQVQDLMTTDLVTIDRNDDLRMVEEIMEEAHIRHIPVIEDGTIVGLVSQRDVFKARMSSTMGYGEKGQRAFLHNVRVKEVMVHPVITVAPDTPLTEAVDLMLAKGIGCLPVVRDTVPVGILTKTDLLARLRALSAESSS
jgi:CBS domain-containing protein